MGLVSTLTLVLILVELVALFAVRPVRTRYELPIADATAVAFSADGQTIAIGRWKALELRDSHTGRLQRSFSEISGWVRRIAFSPEGNELAVLSGSDNGEEPSSVNRFNLKDGSYVHNSDKQRTSVCDLSFSRIGALALARDDASVEILRRSSGPLRFEMGKGYLDSVVICFSLDGTLLAGVGHDRILHVWSVRTGNIVDTIRPPHTGKWEDEERIVGIHFLNSDKKIILLNQNGVEFAANLHRSQYSRTCSTDQLVTQASFSTGSELYVVASAWSELFGDGGFEIDVRKVGQSKNYCKVINSHGRAGPCAISPSGKSIAIFVQLPGQTGKVVVMDLK